MKIIAEIKFGSHLYGTATEKSDIDIRGVYIPDAQDILLGRPKKSFSDKIQKGHGEKNEAGELDKELYSLQHYCHLLAEGQTVALDMIFAPEENLIVASLEWEWLQKNRKIFLSKQYASFVGYCRNQANKYGIKGSRVAAVKAALQLLCERPYSDIRLKDIWNEILSLTESHDHMAIMDIEQPGSVIRHWEIVGRRFPITLPISQVIKCLEKIKDNYGKRSAMAEQQNGIDWKALSHAVRIGHQAIELLTTHHITFPVPNASHILAIKEGKLSYQEIAAEIESLLEKIEKVSEKSTLPLEPDYHCIEKFLLYQHTHIINLWSENINPINYLLF